MKTSDQISGLIAAPFTPMDANGGVRYDQIPGYYDFLVKNRVSGAFINGSTGEGPSLTSRERMTITEHWMARSKEKGALKIINLVGGTSYAECVEHARHSADLGVDAIAVLAPYYFKPSSVQTLVGFVARVAESVPQLPVFYYHIPVLTGCNLPMADFLKVAAPLIPNLAGIKFTQEDFMDYLTCLRMYDGRFTLLWGRDECLLSALVLGARGAVGSTYNYAAPLYLQLIDAFDNGDLERARELQMASIRMISLLGKYGGMGTGKAFMKHVGLECGPFRSPVNTLNQEAYDQFAADVTSLAMEHYFSVR